MRSIIHGPTSPIKKPTTRQAPCSVGSVKKGIIHGPASAQTPKMK